MTNQKPDHQKRYLIKDIFARLRVPKGGEKYQEWEKQYLERKEVEEYFIIHHNSEWHPFVKKYYKSKHFLKWQMNILLKALKAQNPAQLLLAGKEKFPEEGF